MKNVKKFLLKKKILYYEDAIGKQDEYDDYEKKKRLSRGPQAYTYNMISSNDLEKIWLETDGANLVKYLEILATNGRKFRLWTDLTLAIKELRKKEKDGGKK